MDKENEVKKEGILCPECGAENPRNRLTCQVCTERLNPKSGKLNPFGNHGKTGAGSKGKDKSVKKEKAETPTELPQEPAAPPSEKKKDIPPAAKRTRRRKKVKKAEDAPVFFILQGSKLVAVNIIWGVMRPLKKKSLSSTEQNVLSVWNRNKDLFQS